MDFFDEMKEQLKRTGYIQSYSPVDYVARSAHGHEYHFNEADDMLHFLASIDTQSTRINISDALKVLEMGDASFRNGLLPVYRSCLSERKDGIYYMYTELMVDIPRSDYALIVKTTGASVVELVGTRKEYYLENVYLERSLITPEEIESCVALRKRNDWKSLKDMGYEICSGYRIFRSEGNVVAGFNPRAPEQFVTWIASWDEARNEPDYRSGRYTNSYHRVERDLIERSGDKPVKYMQELLDRGDALDITAEIIALEDYGRTSGMNRVLEQEVSVADIQKYESSLKGSLRELAEELDEGEEAVQFDTRIVTKEYIAPIADRLWDHLVVMQTVSSFFRRVDEPTAPYFRCEDQHYFFIELPNGEREPLKAREEMSRTLVMADHNIVNMPTVCKNRETDVEWER